MRFGYERVGKNDNDSKCGVSPCNTAPNLGSVAKKKKQIGNKMLSWQKD